LKSFSIVLVAG